MGNGTFSFISSFALLACVRACVALCLYMLVHKNLGQMCGFVSLHSWVGGTSSVCVSSCTDVHLRGDTGIISHGLSHKFECVYLFSSVDVLGCVRLHRGAYLHRTVSTRHMSACHPGEVCARTVWGGACLDCHPRGVTGTVQTSTWCGLQFTRTPYLL